MERDKINELIRRFEAAETTLVEEVQLAKQLEALEDPDEDLVAWREYFRLTNSFKNVAQQSQERKNELNRLVGSPGSDIQAKQRKLPLRNWLSYAAAITILITAGLWINKNLDPAEDQGADLVMQETFQDPEDAYEQTLVALAFLSQKLNQGQTRANRSIIKLKELDQAIPNN